MAARRRRMKQAVDEAAGDTRVRTKSEAEDAVPGTEITVTWGEETFSPVQYNSFRIGGHSITVTVQEGESWLDAWRRGWAILEDAAQIQFEDKMAGFKHRLDATKGR